MTRIIMSGCNGHMGQVITKICAEDPDVEIVAGIDVFDGITNTYPVFKSLAECDIEADAIIDFSSPKALDGILEYAVKNNVPAVLCSTGLSEDQVAQIKEASTKVAILKSANMSLGVNVLLKTLGEVAKKLAPAGFDIEIVEQHHRLKKDAPSGTALALADAINDALDNEYTYVYDRSTRSEQRPDKEIGLSAVRGGNIVGIHDVIFAGQDEVITFNHTAYSKAIFGKGAVEAAKYLKGKSAGWYDMQDVLN